MLAGCASPSAMTCDEFAQLSNDDRMSTIKDLIKEQDLDPNSNIIGTTSVQTDVLNYCGIIWGSSEATRNNDQPIENAVDWSNYTP